MTLEQKERRKAVLRYAVSVPEWNLALKHRAATRKTVFIQADQIMGCLRRDMQKPFRMQSTASAQPLRRWKP